MSNNRFKFKKPKPKYHFFFGNESVGGFEVDFYMTENKPKDCYVHIHGKSSRGGIFDIKLNGHTYGFLMESARQGNVENIHGFCAMLFTIATHIYTDETLSAKVLEAVIDYQDRLMQKGAEQAKQVTEAEEAASQAYMEGLVEYANASPKEREQIRREEKEIMKDILKEEGEE